MNVVFQQMNQRLEKRISYYDTYGKIIFSDRDDADIRKEEEYLKYNFNHVLYACSKKGYTVQSLSLIHIQMCIRDRSNNNAAQAPYVKQLVDAGIPVITTNPTTHQSDLDGSDDDSVMEGTGTVDADPIEQAKVSAERAVEEVPENANVVVLRGPSGNYHAEKRREAWDTYFFKERPDVTILYEDYANWNSDEALALMESWVQSGTHIDAIISMNDNMAAGAIEAIRKDTDYVNADGTTSFFAYGVDGTAQGDVYKRQGICRPR